MAQVFQNPPHLRQRLVMKIRAADAMINFIRPVLKPHSMVNSFVEPKTAYKLIVTDQMILLPNESFIWKWNFCIFINTIFNGCESCKKQFDSMIWYPAAPFRQWTFWVHNLLYNVLFLLATFSWYVSHKTIYCLLYHADLMPKSLIDATITMPFACDVLVITWTCQYINV